MDGLDLSALYAPYEGDGRRKSPYEPRIRTIYEFRHRHLADFKRLFVEVVRLASELGVANFGKLAIDGTKVRANASRRKAMSYARMQEEARRLQAEIKLLLEQAQTVDEAEDER